MMDSETVKQSLVIDPGWVRSARQVWLTLIELAVWGDLGSSSLGTVPRVRKRVLEVGEKFRSMAADRAWIPHPREQVKNALACALGLKDSLSELELTATSLDRGADIDAFFESLRELRSLVAGIEPLEGRWAQLLDSQYREGSE